MTEGMNELQHTLFSYMLAVGYIPEEVAQDSSPTDVLVSSIDVITEQAHDGQADPTPLLALARVVDIACFGPTADLAKQWSHGELENTEQEQRLLERVRLTMERVEAAHDSFEPVEEAQATAVIELVGSMETWVGRLIDHARGAR